MIEINKSLEGLDTRIYGGQTRVVVEGHYCGFKYSIMSINGSHPSAYIFKDNAFGLDINQNDCCFDVHGGITFEDDIKIGWDYAHSDDYLYPVISGKKWTVEKVLREIKAAIRAIPKEILEWRDVD